MKIQQITDSLRHELELSLAQFEEQFTYPLGAENRFRISHGDDYLQFYRSMGESACFVAEHEGVIVGIVSVAIRHLQSLNGDLLLAAYIGDLKIVPTTIRGRVLVGLVEAVQRWSGSRGDVAFGVVMGGSDATPDNYTGRLGIPRFDRVGEVAILRITCTLSNDTSHSVFLSDESTGSDLFMLLSQGRYATEGGQPLQRSETVPQWLCDEAGHACGRLEDTRRAKRLFDIHGLELMSAHLSCFAFDEIPAAVRLIVSACELASTHGFSHLFVAVDESDRAGLLDALPVEQVQVASATVYGVGITPGKWNLNTAEI